MFDMCVSFCIMTTMVATNKQTIKANVHILFLRFVSIVNGTSFPCTIFMCIVYVYDKNCMKKNTKKKKKKKKFFILDV